MMLKQAKTNAQIIAHSPMTELNEVFPNWSVERYAVSREGKINLVNSRLEIITTRIGAKAISSAKDQELYEVIRSLSILKESETATDAEISAAEKAVFFSDDLPKRLAR